MKLPIPFPNPRTYPGHSGVDFGQRRGTPIPASGNGRVSHRGRSTRGGCYIWVKYDNGPLVGYHHMDNHGGCPPDGARVREGTRLGYVGSLGKYSTGPHLHSEISGQATTAGYWRYFDPNRVVGSKPAGDNITPLPVHVPTQRGGIDMPMLYTANMPSGPVPSKFLTYNGGLAPSKPTYFLLGGSPGTPLNAAVTQDQTVASNWAKQLAPTLDNPSSVIIPASWAWANQLWDHATAPLRIDFTGLNVGAAAGASPADVTAAADRVIAAIPTEFTAK